MRPRAPRMGLRWPRMGRAACRPCFPFSDSSPSCELPTSWRSGRPRRATLQSCRPLRRLRASGHRRPWRSLGCGPAGIAAWCAPLERKSAHGPTRGTGVLSEDAAATRRSGTAVATAAWVDYLERLAERMRLQLMRAELARARTEAQASRKWALDLVIRSRDASRDIVSSQHLTPCIDQWSTRHSGRHPRRR